VDEGKGFYVAPFGIDGQLEGCEFVDCRNLSEKWLVICGEHLKRFGASFDEPWSGALGRIRTRFTSAQGVALVTFFVADQIAASVVLATGATPTAEAQALQMFVESMRRSAVVQAAAPDGTAFRAALVLGHAR
jgi:hypothetical protein